MKIWANCLVHNEENFIWFAVKSVIDYVDKILIWDNGSTDNTVKIIEFLKKEYPDKIDFKELGDLDKYQITKARQEMLNESKSDYILVLDGDEIWFKKSIEDLVFFVKSKGETVEAVVVPFYQVIGDVYHYQDENVGQYRIAGKKGHLQIKAINKKIPGLHVDKPYLEEGFFNIDNKPIQDVCKLHYLNSPYFHASHLRRSSKKKAI